MNSRIRVGIAVAASIPLALVAPALASAATAADVTYAFTTEGSSVTNTITNNSGSPLACSTTLVAAPNGVLPTIAEINTADQSLNASGQIQTGVSTQSVTQVPAGSYAVLATCGRAEADPATWVADYPGLGELLAITPNPSYAVQQPSEVVTISAAITDPEVDDTPTPTQPAPTFGSFLNSLFGFLLGS